MTEHLGTLSTLIYPLPGLRTADLAVNVGSVPRFFGVAQRSAGLPRLLPKPLPAAILRAAEGLA